MMQLNRPSFPSLGPGRPGQFGGLPQAPAPGSDMTRPIQRNVLQPQQTFARPFSQIGSPGARVSYPTF